MAGLYDFLFGDTPPQKDQSRVPQTTILPPPEEHPPVFLNEGRPSSGFGWQTRMNMDAWRRDRGLELPDGPQPIGGMSFTPGLPGPMNIFEGANSPWALTDPMDSYVSPPIPERPVEPPGGPSEAQGQSPLPPMPRYPESPLGGFPEAPRAIPTPTPRPAQSVYTLKKGDNPTKVAKMFGMTVKELAAKNPGLLKKSRRLKVGMKLNV